MALAVSEDVEGRTQGVGAETGSAYGLAERSLASKRAALISSSGSEIHEFSVIGRVPRPPRLSSCTCQVLCACLPATQSGEKGRVALPRDSPGQVQPRSHATSLFITYGCPYAQAIGIWVPMGL